MTNTHDIMISQTEEDVYRVTGQSIFGKKYVAKFLGRGAVTCELLSYQLGGMIHHANELGFTIGDDGIEE